MAKPILYGVEKYCAKPRRILNKDCVVKEGQYYEGHCVFLLNFLFKLYFPVFRNLGTNCRLYNGCLTSLKRLHFLILTFSHANSLTKTLPITGYSLIKDFSIKDMDTIL